MANQANIRGYTHNELNARMNIKWASDFQAIHDPSHYTVESRNVVKATGSNVNGVSVIRVGYEANDTGFFATIETRTEGNEIKSELIFYKGQDGRDLAEVILTNFKSPTVTSWIDPWDKLTGNVGTSSLRKFTCENNFKRTKAFLGYLLMQKGKMGVFYEDETFIWFRKACWRLVDMARKDAIKNAAAAAAAAAASQNTVAADAGVSDGDGFHNTKDATSEKVPRGSGKRGRVEDDQGAGVDVDVDVAHGVKRRATAKPTWPRKATAATKRTTASRGKSASSSGQPSIASKTTIAPRLETTDYPRDTDTAPAELQVLSNRALKKVEKERDNLQVELDYVNSALQDTEFKLVEREVKLLDTSKELQRVKELYLQAEHARAMEREDCAFAMTDRGMTEMQRDSWKSKYEDDLKYNAFVTDL